MKITLKQGLVITLIFGLVVVGFSLVGNNQRVNADGSVTRLSISEIKELFSLFSSDEESEVVIEGNGDIDEYIRGIVAEEMNFGGTTNYDSLSLGENLTVTGTSAFTGTTTMALSPDGFVVYGGYTTSATATNAVLWTNSGNDVVCDGASGYLNIQASGYTGGGIFALGTSTSATVGALNLVASTTIATTTASGVDNFYPFIPFTKGTPIFKVANGESIIGGFDDVNAAASTTYLSNWDVEFGVHCWTMGN